jgi:CubicO group peptidase (beta-lactamase class C family)
MTRTGGTARARDNDGGRTAEARLGVARILRLAWLLALGTAPGLLAPGHLQGQAMPGGEWRTDVRAFAERLVGSGLAPGFGLGVAVGDWVVFEEGFGAADLAAGRGVDVGTPFYIASTTKSLTALAAVLLAERGELDLGAPFERYVPGVVLHEGVPPGSISVRHLVTLTHGLSGSGPIVVRTAFTGDFDPATLPALLHYHADTGTRGTFSYDNLGFNLLGMVLEGVTGEPWQEVVAREVLEPVAMRSTTARLSELPTQALAQPHGMAPGGGFRPIELQKDDRNLHAAGGHFATAGDMARYLAVHLSGGWLEGRAVLPAGAVTLTHREQVPQDRRFGPFVRHAWGMGWDIGTFEGEPFVHRFGSFAGYRSHVSFMPERGVGVVVLTNGDGVASPATDLLATYIYDRLNGRADLEAIYAQRLAELEAQRDGALQAMAADRANRATRLRPLGRALEAFAGAYESEALGRIEFREVAEGLEFRFGVARGRVEVFDAERSALRIEVGGSGMVVEFRFGPGGEPAQAVVLQGVEFTRVEG